MGTKETSEKLLASLYERAKRDAGCPNNFKTTLRCVELLRILQGLGVFCFIGDDGTTPASADTTSSSFCFALDA